MYKKHVYSNNKIQYDGCNIRLFINQRTLRQNIDLPISPVRRLNALYSPVKHQSNDLERGRDGRNLYQEYQTGFKNTTTKQQSNFSGTGLLDMNKMQRIQYVNALKHEQKISLMYCKKTMCYEYLIYIYYPPI